MHRPGLEAAPRNRLRVGCAAQVQLLSVNDAEYQKNPGRRLLTKKGSRYELASHGLNLLDLLTY